MSNLGRYQEIVTQARALGGVDKLIESIETAAVTSATPRILAIGASIGAAIAVGVTGAVVLAKRFLDAKTAGEEAAENAKGLLRKAVGDEPQGSQVPEVGEHPDEQSQEPGGEPR